MRLLFVSLSLLLLPLCRPSDGEDSPDDFSKDDVSLKAFLETVTDLVKIIPDNQKVGVLEKLQYVELFVATAFLIAQPGDMGIKNSLENSIVCALNEANFKADFKKAMYIGERDDATKTAEETFAEKLWINCADPDDTDKADFNCFCTENNPIVYCAAEKYKKDYELKDKPSDTCPGPAFDALKGIGNKELGKIFEFTKLSGASDEYNAMAKAIVSETEDASDKIVGHEKVFCDALNDGADEAVKKLFAVSVALKLAEAVKGGEFYPEDMWQLFGLDCESDEDFKSTVFGKCLCPFDKGFRFCLYKDTAQKLKDIGYLKCDSTPELDPAKKDEAKKKIKEEVPKAKGNATSVRSRVKLQSESSALSGSASVFSLLGAATVAAAALLG